MQNACAVLCCHLSSVKLCNIFPHYFTIGAIFEKKKTFFLNRAYIYFFEKEYICIFFRKSRRFRNNVEKYCRNWQTTDDDTIRRMRFSCWIIKTTNTYPEYVRVIRIAIRRQQLLRKCYSKLRVRYIACLVTTWISNVKYVSISEQLMNCQHCFGFRPCLTRESDKRSFLISNVCAGNVIPCHKQRNTVSQAT